MNYIKEIVSLDRSDCVDLKKDFDPEDLHKASCGPYNPSESRLFYVAGS